MLKKRSRRRKSHDISIFKEPNFRLKDLKSALNKEKVAKLKVKHDRKAARTQKKVKIYPIPVEAPKVALSRREVDNEQLLEQLEEAKQALADRQKAREDLLASLK